MSQATLARRERRALGALLHDLGPDAPTLCDGWTTRDLAAHLYVRENRPDAAGGIIVRPLAGYLERVQSSVAARPYDEVVDAVANGPRGLSPFALPGVDSAANTAEFLVHHEDARRGQPGWQPRELEAADADRIWRTLPQLTRLATRHVSVGLVARHPDGRVVTLRKGSPVAVIEGEPLEILLYLFGRKGAAQVEFTGDEQACAAVRGTDLAV